MKKRNNLQTKTDYYSLKLVPKRKVTIKVFNVFHCLVHCIKRTNDCTLYIAIVFIPTFSAISHQEAKVGPFVLLQVLGIKYVPPSQFIY